MIGWIITCCGCDFQSHGLISWMGATSLLVVLADFLSCFLEDGFTYVFRLRALKVASI